MNGTQIIKILKHARERVAKGWTQHQAADGEGNVCAAQAITYAVQEAARGYSGLSVDDQREQINLVGHQLLLAAREQTSEDWGSIPSWNDYHSRTQQEVVDTFDHAIKTIERDCGPEDAA